MASGVFIEVIGLEEIRKKLGSIPENISREVDAEMAATANEFVNRAVAAAPVDTNVLRDSITFKPVGPMHYEIISGADYSAYVEFGTITRVSVPAELSEYASQFKGKGVRKSGGLYPRPFFFPQLPIARAEFQSSLKEIVARAIK